MKRTLTLKDLIKATTNTILYGFLFLFSLLPLFYGIYELLRDSMIFTLATTCGFVAAIIIPIIIFVWIVVPDLKIRNAIKRGNYSLFVVYEGTLRISNGVPTGNTHPYYAISIDGHAVILGFSCDEYELSDDLKAKLSNEYSKYTGEQHDEV